MPRRHKSILCESAMRRMIKYLAELLVKPSASDRENPSMIACSVQLEHRPTLILIHHWPIDSSAATCLFCYSRSVTFCSVDSFPETFPSTRLPNLCTSRRICIPIVTLSKIACHSRFEPFLIEASNLRSIWHKELQGTYLLVVLFPHFSIFCINRRTTRK
jgi:hypothetical protein